MNAIALVMQGFAEVYKTAFKQNMYSGIVQNEVTLDDLF